MVAADAAAFANEAEQPFPHGGIVVDHAADVVQVDGIEFLDARVLEQLQVVAEDRFEGAGVLADQLEQPVAVRDRAVPGVHLQVGHEQLARLARRDDGLARHRRLDRLPVFRAEAIAAPDSARLGRDHADARAPPWPAT